MPQGCLCSRLLWSGDLHLALSPSRIKSLCPYALLFRRASASYKRDFHDRVFHKFAHSRRLRVHRCKVISHLVHKPPQAEECYLLPCRRRHKTHPRRFWTGGNAFSYIARKSGTGGNCGGRRANVNARVRLCVVYKRSGAEERMTAVRGGRDVETTILKCANFDKTSL